MTACIVQIQGLDNLHFQKKQNTFFLQNKFDPAARGFYAHALQGAEHMKGGRVLKKHQIN